MRVAFRHPLDSQVSIFGGWCTLVGALRKRREIGHGQWLANYGERTEVTTRLITAPISNPYDRPFPQN